MTKRTKPFRAERASAAEIQDVFGLSEGALRQAMEDGLPHLPRRTNGAAHEFDCVAVSRWLMAREVEARRQPDSAAAELSRLRRSQRELIGVGIEQRRARLIPADDCRRAWVEIRNLFRQRMARVMDDAAGKGWSGDVLDELEASLAESLAELVRDPLIESGGDTGSAE